jgi:hypothetical protein
MCLFTSALRASVNKSHIPSLPQNNLDIINAGFLAILLFLLFPTFLQLSYFSYFLLQIA